VTGTDPQSTSGTNPELTYFDYFGAIGADIMRLVRIIKGEKAVFGSVLAVALLVGFYQAIFSENTYRAQTLLAPRSDGEGGSIGSLIAGRMGSSISSLVGVQGDKSTRELIAGLKSRVLIYNFIEHYDVNRVLFPGLWDEDSKSWKMVTPGTLSRLLHALNGTPLPPPQRGPTLENGYKRLMAGILNIGLENDSGTITVAFDWRDPKLAATWANGLVALFNDKKRSDVIKSSQSRINFLQAEIGHTTGVETREAFANLIQNEAQKVILAQSEKQFSLRIIDPAVPPEDRIWPKRGLIIFISVLVGIIAGAGAALGWAKIKHMRSARKYAAPVYDRSRPVNL
jgi:hypothetical protein